MYGKILQICVVEDDEAVRVSLENLLRSCGYHVHTFAAPQLFIDSGCRPDCVVSDLHMPGMDGVELKEQLTAAGLEIPVIIVTAFPDVQVRMRAAAAGVKCFLQKPFRGDDLLGCVEAAFRT